MGPSKGSLAYALANMSNHYFTLRARNSRVELSKILCCLSTNDLTGA